MCFFISFIKFLNAQFFFFQSKLSYFIIKNLCITECPKKGVSILKRRRRRKGQEKDYTKSPTHMVQWPEALFTLIKMLHKMNRFYCTHKNLTHWVQQPPEAPFTVIRTPQD